MAGLKLGLLLSKLGLKTFSIYVQDYGAPIGYRIAKVVGRGHLFPARE